MKDGYLKRVLQAGLGPTLTNENRTPYSQPAFIPIQKPVQGLHAFDSTFRGEEYQDETPDIDFISQEIPKEPYPSEQTGTVVDQRLGTEQKDSFSPPAHRSTGERDIETAMHGNPQHELNRQHKNTMDREDHAPEPVEKEVKHEPISTLPGKLDRIPKIEIPGGDTIQFSISDQPGPELSSFLHPEIKDKPPEFNTAKQMQYEQMPIIEKQEILAQKTPMLKGTIEDHDHKKLDPDINLATESSEKEENQISREIKKDQDATDFSRPVPREPKSIDFQNLSTVKEQNNEANLEYSVQIPDIIDEFSNNKRAASPFTDDYIKKTENQQHLITKEITNLKKKMDDHIRQEEQQRLRPRFLPKRPPSRNLGGWSNLERSFIK